MRRVVLALGLALAGRAAKAQIAHTAPAASGQSSSVVSTTVVAPAIQSFRGGLRAAALPADNPGPSPLASVALSWAPYPGASAYQVWRAVRQGSALYPAVFVRLVPTTFDTVRQLAPGATVEFRIVAWASGQRADSTALVTVVTPSYQPASWSQTLNGLGSGAIGALGSGAIGPLASGSGSWSGFANVLGAWCETNASVVVISWSANPAASLYTVQLVNKANSAPLAASTTPGNSIALTVPGGASATSPNGYYVFVRPEFKVFGWPPAGSGVPLDVPGAWTYLGIAAVPSLIAHQPCAK